MHKLENNKQIIWKSKRLTLDGIEALNLQTTAGNAKDCSLLPVNRFDPTRAMNVIHFIISVNVKPRMRRPQSTSLSRSKQFTFSIQYSVIAPPQKTQNQSLGAFTLKNVLRTV